jgi:hypothetical protein
MRIWAVILIVVAMASMSFGQSRQAKIKLHKSPEAMRQGIAKQVPIGRDILAVQRIMEANRFACEPIKDGSFTIGTEEKPGIEFKKIDFLLCTRKRNALAGFIDPRRLFHMREWDIAFVQKGGVVTDILVYVGWFCDL